MTMPDDQPVQIPQIERVKSRPLVVMTLSRISDVFGVDQRYAAASVQYGVAARGVAVEHRASGDPVALDQEDQHGLQSLHVRRRIELSNAAAAHAADVVVEDADVRHRSLR